MRADINRLRKLRKLPRYDLGGYSNNGMLSNKPELENSPEVKKNNFNNFGNNIGTLSAGYYSTKQADTTGQSIYNTGMAGVSKAGPIGGVIGGVTAIGDSIGDPIRKDTEQLNDTGYKHQGQAEGWGAIGGALNPFKAGTSAMDLKKEGYASTGDVILAYTGIGGANLQRKKEKYLLDKRQEERDAMELSATRNAMSNASKFSHGGIYKNNSNPNAELEDEEVFRTPDGELHRVDGNTHAQGGEMYNLPNHTQILGKQKIYGNIEAKAIGLKLHKMQKKYDNILDNKPTELSRNTAKMMLGRVQNEFSNVLQMQEQKKEMKARKINNRKYAYGDPDLNLNRIDTAPILPINKTYKEIKEPGGFTRFVGGSPSELRYGSRSGINDPYWNGSMGGNDGSVTGVPGRWTDNGFIDLKTGEKIAPYQIPEKKVIKYYDGDSDHIDYDLIINKYKYGDEDFLDPRTGEINTDVISEMNKRYGNDSYINTYYPQKNNNQYLNKGYGYLKNNLNKDNIASGLTTLGSVAPILYNLRKSREKADYVSPNSFYNKRSGEAESILKGMNISTQDKINEIKSSQAYNRSIKEASNTVGQYLGNMQSAASGRDKAIADIMFNANMKNNDYKTAYAGYIDRVGRDNALAYEKAYDINTANKAAKENYKSTAMSQIQQVALTEKQNQRLKKLDKQKLNLLKDFYSNYTLDSDGRWVSKYTGKEATDKELQKLIQ